MIEPDIQIAVVGQGFVIAWTDNRGLEQRAYANNRDLLAKTVHRAAEEVRPTKFPTLEGQDK